MKLNKSAALALCISLFAASLALADGRFGGGGHGGGHGPDFGRPGSGFGGGHGPDFGRPGPGFGGGHGPDFGRPGPGFGGGHGPDFGRPGPGFGGGHGPDFGRPGPGHGPGFGGPRFGRPGMGQPGFDGRFRGPGFHRPAGFRYDPNPFMLRNGFRPWARWTSPYFQFVPYDFQWDGLRTVTCKARDAYDYEFPVTMDEYNGYAYFERMEEIERIAVDRCYAESPYGVSCYLYECTPGYR